MNKIFNFSAGPSMLPKEVLNQVERELHNWNNSQVSVMEIGHRSHEFYEIAHGLESDLRDLLNIPKNYKVLFCHGGARTQFSSIPMNLLGSASTADYIDSGYWSRAAAKEAERYCKPNLIDVNIINDSNIRSIQKMKYWKLSYNSAYLHYCSNETIDGIAIHEIPNFDRKIVLVGDFSSTLLSEPLDITRFGMIYAASQKNIGIPGLTVVIIREDLLDRVSYYTPTILQYCVLSQHQSMFNTPVTFSWYISWLICQWIKRKGGISEISIQNRKKANLLYKVIDTNQCYYNCIAVSNRSYMNVPFFLYNEKLNEFFLKESYGAGLYALKGHRVVGGMRASLYNAMSLTGVQSLVEFMIHFSKKYG